MTIHQYWHIVITLYDAPSRLRGAKDTAQVAEKASN